MGRERLVQAALFPLLLLKGWERWRRKQGVITIDADHLSGLVDLKSVSDRLMARMRKNFLDIMGVNSGLILLGVTGLVQPTASALAHNVSTLAISVNSMRNLLE